MRRCYWKWNRQVFVFSREIPAEKDFLKIKLGGQRRGFALEEDMSWEAAVKQGTRIFCYFHLEIVYLIHNWKLRNLMFNFGIDQEYKKHEKNIKTAFKSGFVFLEWWWKISYTFLSQRMNNDRGWRKWSNVIKGGGSLVFGPWQGPDEWGFGVLCGNWENALLEI